MADLVPLSFGRLVTRMMRELRGHDSVFDLPLAKCFLGSPDHDLSVRFHGRRAATPFGPAAGPHSQMAQNLVLSWAAGSRILELKTVQVLDELDIARPCIDMRTVGYNIEWSQELKLEESLHEYVKGAMLVEMLKAELGDRLAPGFADTVWDMSVGYDLAGIRSPGVRGFLAGMHDCSALVDRLRSEIPGEFRALRDLPFATTLSDTLTLSTFHGCPPDEIERILDHLIREHGLNVVVKLNPTLLGREEVARLLHDVMGYDEIRVPEGAFAKDTTWEQACGFVERLTALASAHGMGFGVKLTNTLVVEHTGDFLPEKEQEKYLSGAPLHVLAMHLVGRFRKRFGTELPISFSAGIDASNFADAVALGLTPITVCTDLLRTGGYARARTYFRNLLARMDAAGVGTVDGLVRGGRPPADPTADQPADRAAAILRNTQRYVEAVTADPRYRQEANRKPPRKIGSHLELFDCITCDKCIPVCPNDANFRLPIPAKATIPVVVVRSQGRGLQVEKRATVELEQRHQIGNFADFCNDCGNCDVFCPEDGGPYVVKPRFFGGAAEFERHRSLDGFLVERGAGRVRVRARFEGRELALESAGDRARYTGDGFDLEISPADPARAPRGRVAEGIEVDLAWAVIMDLVQRWVLDDATVNPVNAVP